MSETELVRTLALAFGLGLLVGLERERSEPAVAGFRTFPLVTVLGSVCALLAQSFGGWVLAAGFAGVAAAAVIGNVGKYRAGKLDPGQTTEVALLVMFALGAYLVVGEVRVAVALGGAVLVLLHSKDRLHGLAQRIGERDFEAIARFVVLSLVILPVLPNHTFGPYGVLNPFEIWLMVVLIVAINLLGYLAWKLWGTERGELVGGLLGGMVSSTATTAGYARHTRTSPRLAASSAVVITLAGAVVYARVLAVIGVVAPGFFPISAGPLATMLAVFVVLAVVLWRRRSRPAAEPEEPGNPSELRAALLFALLYAVVLLAVAAAKEHFGARGLYTVAVISGLADMDAITLSTARLVSAGRLAAGQGWRVILVASLANLGFKTAIVAILGTLPLLRRVAVAFAVALLAGLLVLGLWPW
jgi:uncharacterized membrane protein (DUF4010 family)